jgi:hypothetical protein
MAPPCPIPEYTLSYAGAWRRHAPAGSLRYKVLDNTCFLTV